MIISDTTLCQSCGKVINWYYQIPQRATFSRILDIDMIPEDKSKVFRCTHNEGNIYSLTCYCQKCGNRNTFEYESERKLCID